MVADSAKPDYYLVLQVQPGADREVIDAAYRQLMKKYHPDRAGEDPANVERFHERSKLINEAYSVLRDARRRSAYDANRQSRRTQAAPPGAPAASRTEQQARPTPSPPAAPRYAGEIELPPDPPRLPGWLASAYYLLPGPYEWEAGHGEELLAAALLPLLGVAGFALATGRLSALVGATPTWTLLAWAVLALGSVPIWRYLPRVAFATLPSLVLASGMLDGPLLQAHMPAWLTWAAAGVVSLVLSARLYVFSVLPMLGVCWLITRFS